MGGPIQCRYDRYSRERPTLSVNNDTKFEILTFFHLSSGS